MGCSFKLFKNSKQIFIYSYIWIINYNIQQIQNSKFDTAVQNKTAVFGYFSSKQLLLFDFAGGGPRVVVSTAAFHARVRGSVPGLGGLKETIVSSPSTCES